MSCHRLSIIIFTLCFFPYFLSAQSFQPDESFGLNGISLNDFGLGYLGSVDVKVASDGKIWVAGYTDDDVYEYNFLLCRYDSNGLVDTTFGDHGKIVYPFSQGYNRPNVMVLQPDGKVLLAGQITPDDAVNYMDDDIILTRINPDGSLDESFGNNGILIEKLSTLCDDIRSLALQHDGKILAAGYSDSDFGSSQMIMTLIRYLPDGTRDSEFGLNGVVTSQVENTTKSYLEHVGIRNDGSIIVSGQYYSTLPFDYPANTNIFISAFDTNGLPLSEFGNYGTTIIDVGYGFEDVNAMKILPDDKILLGGNDNLTELSFIIRISENGEPDPEFGINGIVSAYNDTMNLSIRSLDFFPDQTIVATGNCFCDYKSIPYIKRFYSTGFIDSTFGVDGMLKIESILPNSSLVFSTEPQRDGKLLLLGTAFISNEPYQMMLLRYNTGSLFGTPDAGDISIYPNPVSESGYLIFSLPEDAITSIYLHDIRGRKINTYIEEVLYSKGTHSINISFSEMLSRGIYIISLTAGESISTLKIIK